jgi:WD40 repeat protein
MNHRFYTLIALLIGTIGGINAALVDVATAPLGGNVYATAWLFMNGTHYATYAGYDPNQNKGVRLGIFNPNTNAFNVIQQERYTFKKGSTVRALDWLNISNVTGAYLAAGGFTNYEGKEIVLYRFSPLTNNLVQRFSIDFNANNLNVEVFSVKWIVDGGNYYLAVGGNDNGKEIRMYSLDISSPSNPVLNEITTATAFFNHGEVRSLDTITVNGTIYLVAGGNEIASIRSEIKVYEFDPIMGGLILRETGSMNSGTANAVKFHMIDGVLYLAAGGNDAGENAEIRIFTYDTLTNTLTFVSEASFDNGIVNSLSWGENNGSMYLVAGGDDGDTSNVAEKRVYSFNTTGNILTEVATASLNGGIVYASEFQNINGTLYIAEGGDTFDPANVEAPFRIEQFTPGA